LGGGGGVIGACRSLRMRLRRCTRQRPSPAAPAGVGWFGSTTWFRPNFSGECLISSSGAVVTDALVQLSRRRHDTSITDVRQRPREWGLISRRPTTPVPDYGQRRQRGFVDRFPPTPYTTWFDPKNTPTVSCVLIRKAVGGRLYRPKTNRVPISASGDGWPRLSSDPTAVQALSDLHETL